MSIEEFLNEHKKLQTYLIDFLDEEGIIEDNFKTLQKFLIDHNICNDRYSLKELFHLIVRVCNNHHRSTNFFNKVERILDLFKKDILNYFSNYEIFIIFQSNKRILLFLIKEKIITIDISIVNKMMSDKYLSNNYPIYFLPEIKEHLDNSLIDKIMNGNPDLFKNKSNYFYKIIKNEQTSSNEDEQFEHDRQEGENDSYICSLIRNDSVEEFITYVNEQKLSFSMKIKKSVFETNPFLLKNDPTLIEYAAFFGSLQIFQFLQFNNVELPQSLWFYSIHSNNSDFLCNCIEKINDLTTEDFNYLQYCTESIKCHHNDIANYICEKYLLNIRWPISKHFKHHNLYFIRPNDINIYTIAELCKNDYIILFELLFNKITSRNDLIDQIFFKYFF